MQVMIASLSILIKEFVNRFQDSKKKKKSIFFYICNSIFSGHKYANFQMESLELQSDIHLKNLIMSLY